MSFICGEVYRSWNGLLFMVVFSSRVCARKVGAGLFFCPIAIHPQHVGPSPKAGPMGWGWVASPVCCVRSIVRVAGGGWSPSTVAVIGE